MPTYKTYSRIVVFNVPTMEQNFKEFVVEIREQGDDTTLVTKISGGTRDLKDIWWMNPVKFDHTVKGTVYEHRTYVRNINNYVSPVTVWVTETAGDTAYGSASWTNTLTATSHSIIVAFDHTDKPNDFDRVEIYVKTSTGLTDPNSNWDADFTLNAPLGEYHWSAQREVTKYFYIRAYDKSGNYSSLVEIGSSSIIRIDWNADMDATPPDSATVSGALEDA